MLSNERGSLFLISGPMFSGKTDELIKIYQSYLDTNKYSDNEILVVKATRDLRDKKISSRSGSEMDVNLVSRPKDILGLLKGKKVIFVDEFQFFTEDFVSVVKKLKDLDLHIVCAGLDKDFRKIDFPIYAKILNLVDFHILTTAICFYCKKAAKFSQKLENGRPASPKSKTIEIELKESLISYRPTCEMCHK